MDERLESMWDSHRNYVRRFLIGLTRDVDLAEDLLQDTFLCAWRGISGYRGGSERAWLSTIARNAYLSHVRRACVRSEVQADADLDDFIACYAGSMEHVDRLDLRSLLSELPDDLRTTLVMKYDLGMTYPEIARLTGCATVTARSRGHRAITLIRSRLDERWKPAAPVCDGMSTGRALDYLYGLLREESMEAVEEHLRGCEKCRERVGGVRALIRTMDSRVALYRQMHLLDVDDRGVPSLHVTSGDRNMSGQPLDTLSFGANRERGLRSLAVSGARLGYDASPYDDRPHLLRYTAELPNAVLPGQDLRTVMAFGPLPTRRAVRTDSGTYRLDWDQMPNDARKCAYVQAIRLPQGARLLSINPAPADVITNGSTTLVWRSTLKPAERFRSVLEYRLDS